MISVRGAFVKTRPAEAKVMRIGNKSLLAFLAVILTISLRATQDSLTIFTSQLGGGVAPRILSRMIAHRMEELVGATRVISQGDLTKTVAVDSRDELGQLADAFNRMIVSLQEVVRETKGMTDKVSQSTMALSDTAAATNQVTEELATRVHQIAKGAERQVVLVGDGSRVGHDLAHSANEIAARSRSAAPAGAQAGGPAKAGEEIREESAQVLTSMEMAGKGIESGRQVLQFTEKSLHEIVRTVVQQVKRVQEISPLTDQQTLGARALVKTIDEIAEVAREHARSTQEASAATQLQIASVEQMAFGAQELSNIADKLRERVSRVKVNA